MSNEQSVADVLELLPCPFCGEQAALTEHFLEQTVGVFCTACQAQMPYVGLSREEAITAWNTRADHASELLEALETIRRELTIANDSIRLGRGDDGSGKVKVATAIHRGIEFANAAIARARLSPSSDVVEG